MKRSFHMPRFEVLAGKALVGHSELELGDAPMGVAGGKLLPSPEYAAIQPSVINTREGSQAHLALVVRLVDGRDLPAQGGVHITDYSAELGLEDGLQVEVLGIGYPLYEELFPEQIAAYKAQIAKAK
jgi:hypothetical protein